MKNNKSKKPSVKPKVDEFEAVKPKKKIGKEDTKINVRSKKFWEKLYDDEGEELEKFIK